MNPAALMILGALHADLLARADVAVARRRRFPPIDTGLAALQRADFAVRQRAVIDALVDALLLMHVARDVALQALGRPRVGIARLAIVLLGSDVGTRAVLHAIDSRLLLGRQLAVLEVASFGSIDARFLALELTGFACVELAGLKALLDALLLVHIAVDDLFGARPRGVRTGSHRAQNESAESTNPVHLN